MNALIVFSVLVASCYAGYDKKHVGVGGVYPPVFPGNYPGYQKYGTCPRVPDYGALGRYCFNDYQCPGQQKCCNVWYGQRRCQVPIEFQRPGNCPVYYPYGGNAGYGGYCNTDWQCGYGQKCCAGYNGDVNRCTYVYYNGPYPGGVVGGPYPGGVVGGPYPGGVVGGPYPGGVVGGPYPGGVVGGPYPGGVVGGPYPAGVVGGVAPVIKKKVY